MSHAPQHDTDTDLNGDHIAFLKTLVGEGPKSKQFSGALYLCAGLVFSAQTLAQSVAFNKPYPAWLHLSIAIVPTLIFLSLLFWVLWKKRKSGDEKGVAQRAMNAAWTSTGLTNMVMVGLFGWLAWSRQDIVFWMLYPPMLCAVQGAAWYVAYMIRKQLWQIVVSLGWFASAIVLALFITQPQIYLLVISAALLLCMAVPGWIMLRQAKEA